MPDNRKPLIYGAFPVCRNYTVRAHLCHTGFTKRRGCENRQQYAGTLRCGVHPAYLHPRHPSKAGRSRTDHGQLHGTGDVSRSKREERTDIPSAPLSPFPRISACGSGCGSTLTHTLTHRLNQPKSKEKVLFSRENRTFWSCWADSNRRPHPYQLYTACFCLLAAVVSCCPAALLYQGIRAFCAVSYRCLLCLEKCCFLIPVWVLYGFLVKPIPRDLIPYLQLF